MTQHPPGFLQLAHMAGDAGTATRQQLTFQVPAVVATEAIPRNPPLRSAPARWYFAGTPATHPGIRPGSLARRATNASP
jgi:hypothetical protein